MPARPWVARTNAGMHPTTRQYPLATGESPKAGDFVHLNASQAVVQTTAADPTPILGISEENVTGGVSPIMKGQLLVTIFTNDVILAMEGARAPLLTDIGKSYGIARDAAGVWTVDHTDTTATRVLVVDVALNRNLYFVKILAAHRQLAE